MSDRRTVVVLGTLASNPYAGMAWMHMQIAAGLLSLGHDAYYFETTSSWPYDPVRGRRVSDSSYAVSYLEVVARAFGMADRWAYRRSYADGEWFGLKGASAEAILRGADAVLNVSGGTRLREEGLEASRLVYLGTDPVFHEVGYLQGDADTRELIDEHDDAVSYGENIGTARSPLAPLPRLRGHMRQPVLLERWRPEAPGDRYTTVTNWRQSGRDIVFEGESYTWSKHLEFERFLDVPRRLERRTVLATNLGDSARIRPGRGERVMTHGIPEADRRRLGKHGWRLVDAATLTTDPLRYRDFICGSRAELSIARDLNVRLQSGWFSERSACYLAAARPVVAQDTGFGSVLPVGEGLFSFRTAEEAVAAFAAIEADYQRHSAAARELAREYFAADRVLPKLLEDLDL